MAAMARAASLAHRGSRHDCRDPQARTRCAPGGTLSLPSSVRVKQHRPSTKETVLVLGEDLEQRVAVAARRLGLDPAEFIVGCVERRCTQVLNTDRHAGETGRPRGQAHTEVGYQKWAIPPSETRVLH